MAMDLYQGVRRANRSGGLVQIAGDLGLASAFFFWAWIFWGFIRPVYTNAQNQYSIEAIITGVLLTAFTLTLALCCAVVMPALMAAIFPHTAAAQYLQEIRRSAWGFWLLAVSCGLLAVFSFYILNNWWFARMAEPQPDGTFLADLWLVRAMALMTFIFFVIVPSWASNYGTPVIWLTEVQQAHQVERLKMVHKQQLAIAKAGYRRAMSIMRAGLDTATVEQRTYVADMLVGMHQAEHAMMLDIAGTIGDDLRLEQALPTYTDPAITDNYRQLHHLIVTGTPVIVNDASNQVSAPLEPAIGVPHSAAQRGAAPQYTEEYEAAFARLQPFVTAKSLSALLQIEDRTARDVLSAWEAQGWVTRGNIRGQWSWTKGGA